MTDNVRRYRLLEPLGRGGFGNVYRAELIASAGFSKQVAVKLLNAEGEGKAQIVGLLRDEARILGMVRHRAIVGVHSLAQLEDDRWAVVMEYVPGVDVTMLVSHGPVPARVSIEIIEEVASALHAAFVTVNEKTGEQLALVHRDIKPANIRITAQGEVKILDFGVAQANLKRDVHTSKMLLGSFRYMAPERFDKHEGDPDDPSGDVFSLGLVLAELLSTERFKRPPTDAELFRDYIGFITDTIQSEFDAYDPPVHTEQRKRLIELVESMLSYDVEQRPSAREVEQRCRELRELLAGPYLRDWAETEIRRLQSLASQLQGDPFTGSMLQERTSALPLSQRDSLDHTPYPEEDEDVQTIAIRFAALGAAVFAIVAVLVLVGAFFTWSMLQERQQQAPEPQASARSSAPAASAPQAEVPAGEDATALSAEEEAAETAEAGSAEAQPSDVEEQEPREAPRSGRQQAEKPPSPPTKAREPEPEPAAVKAPPPPAPFSPRAGRVSLDGDVRNVWLIDSADPSVRHPAGPVPPGSYTIKAWFDGSAEAVQAGTVTIREGEAVTLRCNSMMLRCTKAR